ncbi:hypothetical protein McanMca71_007959 [Microsporum canis]|uniref:Uncharacterized protein n=1 Tax=Arthroderma otae (strain ATCC MYA-4605 / CBS 113480) TaxID=554155 RepID=C5FJZ8_ARTOC|nr:uncharacterized protein MCYG_02839 [Microsporum canis CBS 113480]EEQ30020.1 predicted protein [Microsporum canis CBS 113480]
MPTLDETDETYRKVWNSSSFTSFLMLDYLRSLGQTSWSDFISSKAFNAPLKGRIRTIVDSLPEAAIDNICKTGSGRCTTFTFTVIRNMSDGGRDFMMAGRRNHRATFTTDGVVVDPSACKVFKLVDSDMHTAPDKRTWMMENIESDTAKLYYTPNIDENDVHWEGFNRFESHYDGMKVCLNQLLTANSFVLLFRSCMEDGTLKFDGMLRWIPKDNVMIWTEDIEHQGSICRKTS